MTTRKKTYKPLSKNLFQGAYYMLKNSLVRDLKVKIFGLFFAIVFWTYTILGNQYTHIFHVPLNVVNIISGKTLKEPVPDKIKAEFTGKGSDFVFLYLSPISGFRFELDLQNIKYFYNFDLMEYYQVHPEKIIYPRNMDVTFNKIISPDSIEVELDYERTKKIPVVPQIYIDTEAGYIKTGNLQIYPDSIQITGPDFYTRQLDKIYTDSLNLENVSQHINTELKLHIPDSTTMTFSHKKIKIYQNVDQIGEKIIKDIPVTVVNNVSNKNIELTPEKISLKISAGLSHLTRLAPDDFEIKFDYKKSWQAGETYYTPEIIKPEEVVDIIEVIPERLNVRVIRERTSK